MVKFFKYVFQYFTRNRQSLTVRRIQCDDTAQTPSETLDGYIPLEIARDEQPVPGMATQGTCEEEQLLETPSGRIITLSQRKGIRCGCLHVIYTIEPDGQRPHLAGQCPLCTAKGAELLNKGHITLEQAEAMSLYCSSCGGFCEGCGRSFCSRHVHRFVTLDARIAWLCAACIKPAEQDRFFRKVVALMISLFVDDKRPSSPRERDERHDY
ncbi:hypothetical protein ACFL5Z_12885 [Planctomycetota bacterium]